MANWYQEEITAVAQQLDSSPESGLSTQVAQARLEEVGPNELVEKGVKSVWLILWEQLTDVMVVILIIAAVVSAFIGEPTDTIVIIAIVILNALLGVTQEYRAEQAIAALKKLAVPTVRVRRNGQTAEISARELVPGDVVLLESGNLVPADGRVFSSSSLKVEEAALTGESEPVEKKSGAVEGEDVPLGDRVNYVYMGTTVVYGRGEVMITETGMSTELGNIANLLQSVEDEQTPLQRRLDGLGKTLAAVAGVIILVVFVLGLFISEEVSALRAEGAGILQYLESGDVQELFLTAISMAVAAIPEGLPAVVTIALALGSQRLLKRNSLIRKLPAVETLGSVTVICSDKTGTLTENKMTVTFLDVAGDRAQVEHLMEEDREYELAGLERKAEAPAPKRSIAMLLKAGAHCNDGELTTNDAGETIAIGDPTETALIVAADKFGLHKKELDQQCPRVAEVPFTSARKRMTTIHEVSDAAHDSDAPWADSKYVAFTKGAVDNLLDICASVWTGDEAVKLDDEWRQRVEDANAELAQTGHRVLGAAYRPLDAIPEDTEEVEQELTFIGFAGIIDPPRGEVGPAVAECRTAGIRPIMITGDHPLTAQYIAKDLDITRNERVYTGQQLNKTSEAELKSVIEDVSVFARVAPEHKLNIVDALQEKGEVVAMTGDGVNDAPALKKANIGVAMGITGTDVSKEAADMVLLDDNFATIVAAVKEGRTVYDNIRKFI
ncbi:MAG: HAD-IC family P-type ATPase, partial [Anaerolineales bacterium]|nr:HAD-IC family P-type ATPase [Anaerolineales bacterium]